MTDNKEALEALGKMEPCTLSKCPVGLFIFNDCLCFKSEYRTPDLQLGYKTDAYIIESGEYFWGGTSCSIDRENLIVTPIKNIRTALQKPSAAKGRVDVEKLAEQAWDENKAFESEYSGHVDFVEYGMRYLLKYLTSQGHLNQCDWQPIDSMPSKGNFFCYSEWRAMKASASTTDYIWQDGVFLHNADEYTKGHIPSKATHWMPLPKPPTQDEGE